MTGLSPVLTDGVVTLRPFRVDDVPEMVAMGSDPDVARWTTMPQPYTPQSALDHMELLRTNDARVGWAVEAADGVSQRFAGDVELRRTPVPSIGYALAPWARGRGLATSTLRLVAEWAFAQRLPIVHWSCMAGNLASWRVAHRCGFTFHGERPLALPSRDGLVDGWFASLRPGVPTSPRTPWWPTPVLEGNGLRLRPFRDDDVPRVVEACSDPVSQYFGPHLPDEYGEAEARAYIGRARLEPALGSAVTWAVADPSDDRLLASISLFRLDTALSPTEGEIGYWAHPDARGRGVVREAVRLLVAHAFAPVEDGGLGRHRLVIGTSWENAASRAIAERNGFTRFAHARHDGVVGRGAERRLDDGAWYERLRDG